MAKKTKVSPRKASDVVKEGSVVKIHYTGKLNDGEVFDSSEGKDPLEFSVGEHQVIPGFEQGVVGMKVGDKKTLDIKCKDAYGNPHDQLIQEVPKEALGDIKAEVGMMLALQHPQSPQPIPAKVMEIGKEKVKIDMNHPLAGKDLTFDVELVEIR